MILNTSNQMKLKVGILMILLSFVPWALLPVAAWLAPGAGAKAAWSGGLILVGELLFWPGLLLAGKESWAITQASAKEFGWKHALGELWKRLKA